MTQKQYVIDFLLNEYQVDKAGTRKALFGSDAPMREPEDEADDAGANLIDIVGPWGAVLGRKRAQRENDEFDGPWNKRRRK